MVALCVWLGEFIGCKAEIRDLWWRQMMFDYRGGMSIRRRIIVGLYECNTTKFLFFI